MQNQTYRKYSIFYKGEHKEDISATSKKNVMDYIRMNYVSHLVNRDGVVSREFYRTKSFNVKFAA